MSFQATISWLAVAVVILNALTNGWVLEEFEGNLTGPLGTTAAQSAECVFAVMYAEPTFEVLGYHLPLPSGDDTALSLALFAILYFGVGVKLNVKYSILLLVAIWLAIRLVAFYFATSVPGCWAIVEAAHSVTSMFYWVSVLMIPIIIIRFVRR